MKAGDLYLETIQRSDDALRRAVEGLSTDELRNQPAGAGSNPIGWLVWHLTRTRDSFVTGMAGTPTIWEADGWGEKFGMQGEPPRFAPENVNTFDPKDFETLMGYFHSVAEKTAEVFKDLDESDLDRMIESTMPGRPPRSVGARLGIILDDNIQHIGQIAYLRGLIRGHGWF
jgi:uncharacterized damage-inducible protein DinB